MMISVVSSEEIYILSNEADEAKKLLRLLEKYGIITSETKTFLCG